MNSLCRLVSIVFVLCSCCIACGDDDSLPVVQTTTGGTSSGADAGGDDAGSVDAEEDTNGGDTSGEETSGEETTVSCRDAVIRIAARVEGGALHEEILLAESLQTAYLTGDGSYFGEDEEPSRFAWEIVERPEGSTSLLIPNDSHPSPQFFLDLNGVFEVTLRVYDQRGVPSCNVGRMSMESMESVNDLDVQLSWEVYGNRADGQSDLNVHLLHPDGVWNTPPFDCFWLNIQPNWGDVDRRDDDPSLDVDSVSASIPERIALKRATERFYRVGIDAGDISGWDRAIATLRVFIQGRLVSKEEFMFEPGGESFLDALWVNMDTHEVYVVLEWVEDE